MGINGEVVPAKKTRYHKIHARSRTEAKWAVFFDGVRLPYRYESEDTYLAALNKRYLPDFYLSSPIGNVVAEIKGKKPTDLEQEKCYQLCYQEGYPVLLINGSPYFGDYEMQLYYVEYDMLQCGVCSGVLYPTDSYCGKCGNNNSSLIDYYSSAKVVRTREARFEQDKAGGMNLLHASGLPLAWSYLDNALQFAFKLASHARFEYLDNWKPSIYDGECPAINPAFQTQDWTEAELLYNCLEGRLPLWGFEWLVSQGEGIDSYLSLYNHLYNTVYGSDVALWAEEYNKVMTAVDFVMHKVHEMDGNEIHLESLDRCKNHLRFERDSLSLNSARAFGTREYILNLIADCFVCIYYAYVLRWISDD